MSANATPVSPATSIVAVRFYADGLLVGTDTSSPFSVNISPSNGTYSYTAEAEDDLGNIGVSAARTHTIDVPAVTPGDTITTVTYKNESGSSTNANFIPLTFGQSFRKGDIPAGYYPAADVGGTPVAVSWWGKTTYSDGSWRFCGLEVRLPDALASGASVTINISATNVAPSNCSVGLADIDAADLTIEGVGRLNISGTWTAAINSSSADIVELGATADGSGGGPVCRVFTIGAWFRQSGSDHASLYARLYAFVLQNSSGGLYGIRVLPAYGQPFPNKSGDTNWGWLVFESMKLKMAGVDVQAVALPEASHTFTPKAPAPPYDLTTITKTSGITGAGTQMFWAGKMTTTGVLPTGLSTSATYGGFYENNTSMVSAYGPNPAVTLGNVSNGVDGSGTHTITLLPWCGKLMWHYIQPTTGEYVQLAVGTGYSAADMATHPRQDLDYWQETGTLPPIVTGKSSDTERAAVTAVHGYAQGTLMPDEGAPGDDALQARYGYVPSTGAAWLNLSQTLARYRNMVIAQIKAGARGVPYLDHATKRPALWLSGSYPGTGFSTIGKDFRWPYGNMPTGFTFSYSADNYARFAAGKVLSLQDETHINSAYMLGYQATGRPEMLEHMLMRAVEAQLNISKTHVDTTVNGVAYKGLGWILGGQFRDAAWYMRDMMILHHVLPDSHVHRDVMDTWWSQQLDVLEDCYDNRDTLFDDLGFSPIMSQTAAGMGSFTTATARISHMFTPHYMQNITNWVAGYFRQERPATMAPIIALMARWGEHLAEEDNLEQMSSYGGSFKAHNYWDGGQLGWRNAVSLFELGEVFSADIAWNSTTNVFTMSNVGSGRIAGLTNGDRIMFKLPAYQPTTGDPGIGPTPGPGNCDIDTLLYIGDVSGWTFKLYTDEARTSVVDATNETQKIGYSGAAYNANGQPIIGISGGTAPTVKVRGLTSGAVGVLGARPEYGVSGAPDTGALYVSDIVGTFQVGETIETFIAGTARAGSSNTIQLAADTPPNDPFNYNIKTQTIELTGGTGAGQSKTITAFDSTTLTATISGTFSPAPDATTTYEIVSGSCTVASLSSTAYTRFTGRFANLSSANYTDTPTMVQLDSAFNWSEALGGVITAGARTKLDSWFGATYLGSVDAVRDTFPKYRLRRTGTWGT